MTAVLGRPATRPGLREIIARKRLDLERRKRRVPPAALERGLGKALPVRDFARAVDRPGAVSLIAELKKASPSAGLLRPRYAVAAGARAYARAGAAALSVLTEENFFLGDLRHIALAKRASGLPVLRKDFIFDPYQVYEGRVHGADAVLLIAALLSEKELAGLAALVRRLGMTPLVEVHEASELPAVLAAGKALVGINSRNLKDLSMDPRAFERIVPKVPRGRPVVAESGIKTEEDVRRLRRLGVRAMLVGESFLRQGDLQEAAAALVRAGKGD